MDEDLKARLLSDDIATKAFAIGESAELIREILHTAMRGLLVDDHSFVLCMEMERVGPIMVDGLVELLKEAPPGEARVCIAMLLIAYGSYAGVEVGVEEIKSHGSAIHHVVNRFGQAGIDRMGPILVEKLRLFTRSNRFKEEGGELFGNLTLALKNLGIPLPDDVYAALREDGVPWMNRVQAGVLTEEEKKMKWPKRQPPAAQEGAE